LRPFTTRFAPSPTGYLHLGHVVNAIYVWGLARRARGRVRLRIEDHDRIRSRSEFEAAIVEDLAWLGFTPDAGLEPLVRQSDHPDAYEAALAHLRQRHHVYACACSRKEVGGERYPGTCRNKGLRERPGLGLRVQIDPRPERFDDLFLGRIEQTPSDQCGDMLVRDRDGHWTYQFAVTVDDARERITWVIRGADLIDSTARQIRLARMLGRAEPPHFAHHPLIYGPGGEKLSKSLGDTGVRHLRDAGVPAREVIGRAALRVGLVPELRPIHADEVQELFRERPSA
jgi:glutamyl-tRNA synthetase/glutamyl-Q tRNA(Asp) synthetase